MTDYRRIAPVANSSHHEWRLAMWNWIRTWWAAEGAIVRLQALDDRLLADMGLERESVERRVSGRDVPGGGAPRQVARAPRARQLSGLPFG
jgi:uncharacterized protein YjiS (DUF1127 family)